MADMLSGVPLMTPEETAAFLASWTVVPATRGGSGPQRRNPVRKARARPGGGRKNAPFVVWMNGTLNRSTRRGVKVDGVGLGAVRAERRGIGSSSDATSNRSRDRARRALGHSFSFSGSFYLLHFRG
jgi:hypothetical protein